MAGKLFEELLVGQVFQHQPGRTVTEADNVFFSCLTMNPQPLHVDFHAAAKAEFGKPMKVISTGGLAPVFDGSTSVIEQIVPDITARGLIEIFRRSKKA